MTKRKMNSLMEGDNVDPKQRKDLRYMSSQYLADTSLSQDLGHMSSFFVKPDDKPKDNEEKAPVKAEEDLELDDFNSNPCMPVILQLIDVMEQKFGSLYDKTNLEMPKWMFEMHSRF